MNTKVFNKSVIGASHISSGKPCQDYSHSCSIDRYSFIVVSDGHGSDTYVRSEIGSRIAGQIAEKETIKLLDKIYKNRRLQNVSISVGPKPSTDRAKSLVHKKLSQSHEQLDQEIKYFESVENKEEIDDFFRSFFADIYTEWKKQIQEDANLHPFSEEENKKLCGNNIVKAYGCTLIVAVVTEEFYFAFQIGDGKCFFTNEKNEWCQPIPWDCKCFLNITTSLCMDENPVNEFRYTFNSNGIMPVAIMMGSDGVDGCYDEDKEKELELDYFAIIDAFCNANSKEQFLQDLADFLTQKSKNFSRDDMSLSGIVCLDNITIWLQLNEIKKQVYQESQIGEKIKKEINRLETIKANQQKRLNELNLLRSKYQQNVNNTRGSIQKIKEKVIELKNRLLTFEGNLQKEENELNTTNQEIFDLETKRNDTDVKLSKANDSYNFWRHEAEIKVQKLREQRDSLIAKNSPSQVEVSSNEHENYSRMSIDDITKRADSVIFAKMAAPSDCYTFSVDKKRNCYDKESESRGSSFDEMRFNDLIKTLKETVDFTKYNNSSDKMGKEYTYVTFLQDLDQIETFFIPISDELIVKDIFLNLWKFD